MLNVCSREHDVIFIVFVWRAFFGDSQCLAQVVEAPLGLQQVVGLL